MSNKFQIKALKNCISALHFLEITVVFFISFFGVSKAFSSDFVTQNISTKELILNEGNAISLPLGGDRFIKNIIVSAEGIRKDARAEVIVNGEVKGTVYVPGKDPAYIVTVQERATSIEFVGVLGRMRVALVKGVFRNDAQMAPLEIPAIEIPIHRYKRVLWSESNNTPSEFAQSILHLTSELRPHIGFEIYKSFIFPIKKSAARLYAISYVRSDYSLKLRERALSLLAAMEDSQEGLEELLEVEKTFDLALELLSIREELRSKLQ